MAHLSCRGIVGANSLFRWGFPLSDNHLRDFRVIYIASPWSFDLTNKSDSRYLARRCKKAKTMSPCATFVRRFDSW